jgi:hypothetical protein
MPAFHRYILAPRATARILLGLQSIRFRSEKGSFILVCRNKKQIIIKILKR